MLQSTDLPTSSKRFRCAETDPIFLHHREWSASHKSKAAGVGDSNQADTFDGIAIS